MLILDKNGHLSCSGKNVVIIWGEAYGSDGALVLIIMIWIFSSNGYYHNNDDMIKGNNVKPHRVRYIVMVKVDDTGWCFLWPGAPSELIQLDHNVPGNFDQYSLNWIWMLCDLNSIQFKSKWWIQINGFISQWIVEYPYDVFYWYPLSAPHLYSGALEVLIQGLSLWSHLGGSGWFMHSTFQR